ncbi:sensor histidine kinase [Agromyces subbeticus]|uniref:sensor histidine kinase n=1 Tax=Agromyces subbeticus TaxID=293890 RepID=UPI0003B6E0D9|nr:ATP-binding protein [Agromyces subbeticus]
MSAPGDRVRRPMTLRTKIVAGVAALVAGILLTVSLFSDIALRATVDSMVDGQVAASLSGFEHSVHKSRNNAARSGDTDSPKGFGKELVDFVGHAPGTIIAMTVDGEIVDAARFTDAGGVPLDAATVDEIESAAERLSAGPAGSAGSAESEGLAGSAGSAADGAALDQLDPVDLQLAEFGAYRATVATDRSDSLLFVAVSSAAAEETVVAHTIVNLALAAFAILAAVVGVALLVRAALRPLSRVAAAASAVTDVALDSGEVSVPMRVDPDDVDGRTEVGQVGQALELLLRHVDDALRVRSATDLRMRRFITDASHELRTPLAAIRGYAELTRQDSENLPETTEFALSRIESEANRMSSLVSELLLLARLDEGQDVQHDEIDLADLVIAAVSDAQAAYRDHEWIVNVPESAVTISGDPERLHQMMSNLLGNAGVHTPEGTTISVTVTLPATDDAGAPKPGLVRVLVADTGPGIDPELVPILFERFVRGDPSRGRGNGSTGLGLAIVRSIVEAHAGTVEVQWSGAGTTFVVELPAAERPVAQRPVPVAEQEPSPSRSSSAAADHLASDAPVGSPPTSIDDRSAEHEAPVG